MQVRSVPNATRPLSAALIAGRVMHRVSATGGVGAADHSPAHHHPALVRAQGERGSPRAASGRGVVWKRDYLRRGRVSATGPAVPRRGDSPDRARVCVQPRSRLREDRGRPHRRVLSAPRSPLGLVRSPIGVRVGDAGATVPRSAGLQGSASGSHPWRWARGPPRGRVAHHRVRLARAPHRRDQLPWRPQTRPQRDGR